MENMESLVNIFKDEAYEILDEYQELLLEWSDNKCLKMDKIMRLLHTLKGSSAMYDFNKISKFTHKLETIYRFVTDKNLNIGKNLIDSSFDALDYLKKALEDPDYSEKELSKEAIKILSKMKKQMLIKRG